MGRWQPDARGRLGEAALELFGERGYDEVTVAEIAARAGLTERTFFRHFADKREVLFSGSEHLTELLRGSVAAAAAHRTPLAAVLEGLRAAGAAIEAGRGRESARARARIVTANTELAERERSKLASWSAALSASLRERGVGEPAASIAAELGVAVFHVAFERWVAGGEERDFRTVLDESVAALDGLVQPLRQP